MNAYFEADSRGKELLVIEDAKIFWTNFRGLPSDKNAEGHRHFCVTLPEDLAKDMKADGWNVKWTKPKNEEYEAEPYIDVNISWAFKAPYVAYVNGNGRETPIDEELVGDLDTADISYIEMAISPSYKSGKPKGYVNTLLVTLYEDPIRRRRREARED